MKWSKETPTIKGFYWYKEELGQEPEIKELEYFSSVLCFSIGDEQSEYPSRLKGWWYGAIEPPKEENI